jgi:hypothetical protein
VIFQPNDACLWATAATSLRATEQTAFAPCTRNQNRVSARDKARNLRRRASYIQHGQGETIRHVIWESGDRTGPKNHGFAVNIELGTRPANREYLSNVQRSK